MMKRKNYIDIIRSVSVIIIVLFHFSSLLKDFNYKGFSNFFLEYANGRWGRIGVFLFFMISGSGLILSNMEEFTLKKFYVRRWLKIFPLFYLCYIPLYLVDAIIIHKDFLYAGNPLKFLLTLIGMDGYLLTCIKNYYIIGEWFLGAIIILYLIFPLLRKIFLSKYRWIFTIALATGVILNEFLEFPYIPGREWIVFDVFAFWMGMLLTDSEEKVIGKWKALALLVLALVLLFIKLPVGWDSDIVVLLLSIALFILTMNFSKELKVDGKVIKFLGRYSYAIFLVHHVVLALFFELFASYINSYTVVPIILLLFGIIICIAVTATRINQWILNRLCKSRCE